MIPAFKIKADSIDITTQIKERLVSMRITDDAGIHSDTLEITLDDRDLLIELPRHGAELRVELGYQETQLSLMGKYTVDEVELSHPPATMIIRAKAADMLESLKAPKSRSWDEVSLDDIVQTIAAEHGLTARVSEEIDFFYVHVDQTEESDLHLLTRLADEQGAIVKPVNGYLIMVPQGQAKSVSGNNLPKVTVKPDEITSYRVTMADRGKYQSVMAKWHDPVTAQTQEITIGEGTPIYQLRHTDNSANAAIQRAMAKLKALARGSATLSITLPGRSDLFSESPILLSGFRTGVDGDWNITRVEHQLNTNGWQTRLDSQTSNTPDQN